MYNKCYIWARCTTYEWNCNDAWIQLYTSPLHRYWYPREEHLQRDVHCCSGHGLDFSVSGWCIRTAKWWLLGQCDCSSTQLTQTTSKVFGFVCLVFFHLLFCLFLWILCFVNYFFFFLAGNQIRSVSPRQTLNGTNMCMKGDLFCTVLSRESCFSLCGLTQGWKLVSLMSVA